MIDSSPCERERETPSRSPLKEEPPTVYLQSGGPAGHESTSLADEAQAVEQAKQRPIPMLHLNLPKKCLLKFLIMFSFV